MKQRAWIVGGLTLLLATGAVALPTITPGISSLAGQPGAQNDPHYREGSQYLVKNELEQAQAAFEASLAVAPGSARAMLGLAEIAFKRDDLQTADRWIREAARAEPDIPYVQHSLGRLLYLQQDYAGSEQALQRALELAPGMSAVHIALGDLYLNALNDPERAAAAYRQALAARPEHAGAHYALGIALLRQGKKPEAEQALQEAARLQPENPLPLAALGALYAQSDPERAIEQYNRALKLAPNNVNMRVSRGEAYQRAGKYRLAAADYRAVLAADPALVPVYLRLGMLYQMQGESGKAMAAYRSATEHDPKQVLAYNNLAWLAAEQGKELDQALEWAHKARELAPKSATVYDTLGWVYRARKQLDEAIASLRLAVELAPDDSAAHYHLAVVYAEAQNPQAAAEQFRKVMALTPGSPYAQQAEKALNTLR